MKRMIQWIGCAALLLATQSVGAQENINNRFGPPNYTGGTVASPNENFALYQQQRSSASRVVERSTVGILEVYPNPAISYTRVILTAPTTERSTVSVVNMNGVLVSSLEYPAGAARFDIDVSALPDGLYAVQVQEQGKVPQSIQLSKYR